MAYAASKGGTSALKPYLDAVKETLNAALCLQNFASQIVERHNKPEVEVGTSPELILQPITIHRSEIEYTTIEPAVNSCRISMKIKQIDEMDSIIADKFSRFLMQRADNFVVLRRKPIAGYDISFLLTNYNLENMYKHKLIDFVVQFMEEIDSEISAMKIQVNERARTIAYQYLKEFC
uniref:Actin-related protein 2/3 complex subunit 4 n=1 Tax=Phaeocystis antarctica TaxID=33657 RepID=A0A7S0E910_9EUKA|mmetsp:Transcript_73024/g.176202  ORF Transcript_73024/g.176202 Transcript_73024/m.176202 type:complete len:178 (-) Transcript_73024:224-757(-)